MRMRKYLGLAAATLGLVAGSTLIGAGSAQAYTGDYVCRYSSVYLTNGAGNYNVLPCLYQDSSGLMHGKATATGGSTDVYLAVELGYSYNGGPVQWMSWTTNYSHIYPGGGYVYTVPSDGVYPCSPCQYYSKTWTVNNDISYGDVEAGPIYN